MLLAYADESYDADRYWIAALVCPDDQAIPLTDALDAVVEKAEDSYKGIGSTAELHGHSLFHGQDDWVPLAAMPRARIGIYGGALTAIADHEVSIIIRGVNVRRLNERYVYPAHPHAVVLQHLLERIDMYAENRDTLALVIADEVGEAENYRQQLWRFQRAPTGGYRPRQLLRIIDTIHFAPSRASRLVQAADLIAFLYHRIKSGVETDERAVRANKALWDKVSGRVAHTHIWTP
ncbi:MAG: DUF3800 domain-containing protein [Acidimicrobiia bacterium]